MNPLIGMTMVSGTSSKRSERRQVSPFRVMAAGTSWRLFGSTRAAETLLAAMSSDNEQNQMLAGMSLIKAGQRSFDLIQEKFEADEANARIIRLLADIDPQRARPLLEKIAREEPGELTDTARQCIDLLDRIDASDDDRQ